MWIDNLILLVALFFYNKRGNLKFREWLELEQQKEKVIKAVGEGSDEFPNHLLSFISTALHVNSKYFQYAEWDKIVLAFYTICMKSPNVKLPMLEPHDTESNKKDPWDYENRNWNLYAHMIAKSYGWGLDEISQLKIEQALGMIQEIITDEQLDKEFIYSLSEIAYPYNKNTKESKFQPLTRPSWMRPRVKAIRRYPIPINSMPSGVVDYSALPIEVQPKEIIH